MHIPAQIACHEAHPEREVGEFSVLGLNEAVFYVPALQLQVIRNNADAHRPGAEAFRLGKRVFDQGASEPPPAASRDHGKAFEVADPGFRRFEPGATGRAAFAFQNEISDVPAHILYDPLLRAVGSVAGTVFLSQTEALGHVPERSPDQIRQKPAIIGGTFPDFVVHGSEFKVQFRIKGSEV